MSGAKYKFAIMLNGLYMYPWQKKAYDQLVQEGLAECCLIIVKAQPQGIQPKKSLFKKLFAPHFLFEQFKKQFLNKTIYKAVSFEPASNIKVITVTPEKKKKNGESFSTVDTELIKSFQLDFLLRFGFGILKGDILQAAKWGIWSFHHGDEQKFRGGPAGFWEIMKGQRQQGVILQKLTEKLDAGEIILKRHYSVLAHSYTENVTKLMQSSADMTAQAIRMIANESLDINNIQLVKTKARIFKYPTNFQFLCFIYKITVNKCKFKWATLFKQENWIIGYRTKSTDNYKYIAPKESGEYYADPFTFNYQNKSYIVAEHYSYKTKKGSIVLIEPGMNKISTILHKNTHLSYPYIFEENNQIYMIPEECNTGTLNLYQLNGATKTFDFVKTVLDLPAVDASILKHEGKYYLFTGLKDQLPNEKLFIFHSKELLGPYDAHTSNPVKTSPEGARMAGGFRVDNGKIIRPSQYSIKYYGEKVVFQSIQELSPIMYSETYHSELCPSKDAPFKCGLHTYHMNGGLEVIDLKTRQSGYISFKSQL